MTFATIRTYRIIAWLLPIGMVVLARDLLWNQVEAIADRTATLRTLSDRYRKTGLHIRELPDMRNDFERLAHKKMEIASSLLGAKSEASLFELLMLKAGEAGVSITTVDPRPQRIEAGFAELPIELEVCGSFNNLARFTATIESVNRLMRVEELAMSKDRTGRLTEKIKLLVYRAADSSADSAAGKGKSGATFEKREQYLADLNATLAVTIAAPSSRYAYTGQADLFGAVASGSGNKPSAAQKNESKTRLALALKGIVWKEPPLAILESVDGRTFISRQGDTVCGFTVAAISQSEVTITGPQGSHVLHQYDQK